MAPCLSYGMLSTFTHELIRKISLMPIPRNQVLTVHSILNQYKMH